MSKLLDIITDLGYTWRIDGVLRLPTQKDLDQVLDRAKQILYDEPIPSQIEIGRLIIRQTRPGKFEHYLFMGDLND